MAEPTADAALAPGTMVGAYCIDYRVGGGGMGTVYAAVEPTIKKRVAIKVMRHAFAEDATSAARFEREAQAANDVRHPGIVDVFAFGRLPDGRPYLVMSLLEGRSLRDEIAAVGKIPLATAWEIAREVAEALGAAHERGIVHRDLKPDNVFLERFGASGRTRPRVLDFGLAKVTQRPDESVAPMQLTQSGAPMGTPAYMAPEQWWNSGVDARTDQYAFGAMLFEMLAGRPPFASQQFMELVQHHLHDRPPTLASVGVEVPAAVEELVARTLAKTGKERFASMAEIIEAGDAAVLGKPRSVVRSAPVAAGDSIVLGATMAVTPALSGEAAAAVRGEPGPERPSHPAASFRRYASAHAAALGLGFAALFGVGYAAERDTGARDVYGWFLIQGWPAWSTTLLAVIAAVVLVLAGRARAGSGRPSRAVWLLAILPAMSGGFGTYTGWHAILRGLPQLPATRHFAIYNVGMYEATCARFYGFAIASWLCTSLAAMAGVFQPEGRAAERHRPSVAAALGLVALAAGSAVAGALSGAYVALSAALILAAGLAMPIAPSPGAARRELERALAGALAFGLAVAVAIARLEAREAILWDAQPTRAQRVQEILACSAERSATVAVTLAALAVLVGVEALRLRRRWPDLFAARPRAGTWALVSLLALFWVVDGLQYGTFLKKGEQLRTAMEPQFSLFARLDPPPTEALSAEAFAPHPAPALQIARDWIAVNGTRVAKLAAIESADGAVNIGRDLSHGLASASIDAAPGTPDLSVSIDREVTWGVVHRLLRVAHGSGVRRVEILLTRGAPPVIPPGAPPEAGYVVPKDFVAVPAELAGDGLAPPDDRPFSDVSRDLVTAALAAEGKPLRLSIGAR